MNAKEITSTNRIRSKEHDEPSKQSSVTYSKQGKNLAYKTSATGFSFACHWLKNWCDIFKPIISRSNRNLVTGFDSHSKNALK